MCSAVHWLKRKPSYGDRGHDYGWKNWRGSGGPYRADVMLGLRRRRRLLQPHPGRGVDLEEPGIYTPIDPQAVSETEAFVSEFAAGQTRGSGPEDGAEEAAGVVRPERRVGGGVLPAAGGAAAPAAGAAGALVVGGGGGGGGAEEDGLVDLRLTERERQQGPRRVALRRRQQRGRHE